MRELPERAYFALCKALGRVLRSGRYSKASIDRRGDVLLVRKQRLFYAPLLIWLGNPLVKMLGTGVRVLPQRAWQEHERRMYSVLRDAAIRTEADGTLVMPFLAEKTLAQLLEDPALDDSARKRAIELAVGALARSHRLGFTHGDAMAENVLVDLDAGVAYWFDFETVHDANRSVTWRRADDVRALLATCVLRTVPEKRAELVQLILATYADDAVTRILATSFASVWQRPLPFHLAQASLSFQDFSEIGRLLRK